MPPRPNLSSKRTPARLDKDDFRTSAYRGHTSCEGVPRLVQKQLQQCTSCRHEQGAVLESLESAHVPTRKNLPRSASTACCVNKQLIMGGRNRQNLLAEKERKMREGLPQRPMKFSVSLLSVSLRAQILSLTFSEDIWRNSSQLSTFLKRRYTVAYLPLHHLTSCWNEPLQEIGIRNACSVIVHRWERRLECACRLHERRLTHTRTHIH